jgi:hypothetical protein
MIFFLPLQRTGVFASLLLQGETAHAVGDLVAFTLGGVQVAAFDDLDPGGGDVEGARVGADMIPAYGTL